MGLAAVFVICFAAEAKAAQRDQASREPPAEDRQLLELFDEALPEGAQWQAKEPEDIVRDGGGFAGDRWAYMRTRDNNVSISGLAISIRENPEPGEYRYLSFAWQKWGGGQIALQIDRNVAEDDERRRGKLYGYRFDAGEGPAVEGQSLRLSEVVPSQWTEVTRDLWKDFGDFTLTGVTFISVEGRDAAFDRIYLARALTNFEAMPPSYRELGLAEQSGKDARVSAAPILPAQVAAPIDVGDLDEATTDSPLANPAGDAPVVLHSDVNTQEVSIDWGEQIMAGGWTMIPLLVLSVAGVVIGVQRLLTIRVGLIARPPLLPRHVPSRLALHQHLVHDRPVVQLWT
ncbi:MAG TPA: hypothetical protein VMY42_11225 [Thermoguttaceae bacterium]|nr:hypothetical protein [Thermoguttaceae bacterium]